MGRVISFLLAALLGLGVALWTWTRPGAEVELSQGLPGAGFRDLFTNSDRNRNYYSVLANIILSY